MVRPTKPDDEKATEIIPQLRVTKKQKEAYKVEAKANGYTLSAWIKKTLDKASKL